MSKRNSLGCLESALDYKNYILVIFVSKEHLQEYQLTGFYKNMRTNFGELGRLQSLCQVGN